MSIAYGDHDEHLLDGARGWNDNAGNRDSGAAMPASHYPSPATLSTFRWEARAALRSLQRRPKYSLLAIALLTLGVAAVTAIFTVVNASMLRPLPFRDADRLFAVTSTEPAGDSVNPMLLGYFQFARWRDGTRTFSQLEGYSPVTMKFLGDATPEPVAGAVVSAGLFDALGWQPALGRPFARREEVPRSGVVIISHRLWQRRFGGDAKALGTVVNIDEEPRTVIGVMPAGFSMLYQRADAWIPLPLDPQTVVLKRRLITGIGRLRPGATAEQALADLQGLTQTLAVDRPDEHRHTGVLVIPLREWLFGNQRAVLVTLLVAGFFLLVVAVVNVVSLALTDAYARQMSTVTRLAFGADRSHVMRLRLIEFGLLAAAAGVAGIIVSQASIAVARTVAPELLASVRTAGPDVTVMTVAVLTAIVAGLCAGIPTALTEARMSITGLAGSAIKAIGISGENRRRELLIGAQVALAVLMLTGATLLARNIRQLLAQPTGFRSTGVTVVELTFSPNRYKTAPERAEYARRLLDAVRSVPGVTAAATIQTRFVLNETMQTLFEVEGQAIPPGAQRFVNIRHVTPEVSAVLGIKRIAGRMIAETDRMETTPVAVVSASFAKQYFGDVDPIGKRIRRVVTNAAPWMDIVGIADDIKDAGVGVPVGPILYVSYFQQNTASARPTIVIRSSQSGGPLFPGVRRAIWSVDPTQTIDNIEHLDALMLRSAAQPRFAALVATLLALCATTLVLAGIFAVTNYGVLRRTRELGVRAALGASSGRLIWTTVRRALVPTSVGIVVGATLSFAAAALMRQVLAVGISSADLPALGLVLGALVVAAGFAALIPARLALRISPATAMRVE
jgi:predicted permease